MKRPVLIGIFIACAFGLWAQSNKDVNYYICKYGPEFKLVMPNVFTPNGDYVNDHFIPKVENQICITDYYMGIYNRWGQLIYETSVYSVGWHGNTFYGEPYPEGTYFYRMNYTVNEPRTDTQKTISQQGPFQLTR